MLLAIWIGFCATWAMSEELGMTIIGDPDAPDIIIPTHNINKVTATVVWHETVESVDESYQRTCLSQLQECEKKVRGYAYYDLEARTCTIHTVKPVEVIGPEMFVLGHEFAHCLFGDYHE